MLFSAYLVPVLAAGSLALPQQGIYPTHTSGKQQAYLTSGAEYQNAMLWHHNRARANHGAKPLTWSTDCENNARMCANKCEWKHYIPYGTSNGQNIYANNYPGQNATAAVTESWYKNEFPFYQSWNKKDPVDSALFAKMGHLTQLVWNTTTQVGCVTVDCGTRMVMPNGKTYPHFTVCNYNPPGNYNNQFAAHVPPAKSYSVNNYYYYN